MSSLPDNRIPAGYPYINMMTSAVSPNAVHSTNSAIFQFYVKYLLQRVISVFKFENLPEGWAENYFKYVLFGRGYIAVFSTDRYGTICQQCEIGDRVTLFRQPSRAIINNPIFRKTYDLKIGDQCEIIKLQPDYSSVMDIVSTYADLMTMCIETAGINMYNSKAGFVFFANNKAQAESFKKAYDQISSGQPITVVDRSLQRDDGTPQWQFFMPEVSRNYITSNLLNDMRTLENQFNSFIGIPNANTQKRERLISDEVQANNFEVSSLPLLWLETVRKDLEKVNRMFDLDIRVSLRYGAEIEPQNERMVYDVND